MGGRGKERVMLIYNMCYICICLCVYMYMSNISILDIYNLT